MAERDANLADKKHTAKALVCNVTTTGDDVNGEQLTRRLRTEMCLDPQQIARICAAYPEPHIGTVIDYVSKRYLVGKVQQGKIAPYFLATIKHATAESLGLTQSELEVSRTVEKSQKGAVPDNVVDDIAAAKREELNGRKLQAKALLGSLSADDQARLVARYLDWQSVDNHIVFQWIDRRGILVAGFAHNALLQWIADGCPDVRKR